MDGNDGNDNITELRKDKNKGSQKPDLRATAKAALDKARKESFEAKIKDKLKVLEEHEKTLKLTKKQVAKVEAEIKELEDEFSEGL
jgi:Tfp pilus assembly protein FimV